MRYEEVVIGWWYDLSCKNPSFLLLVGYPWLFLEGSPFLVGKSHPIIGWPTLSEHLSPSRIIHTHTHTHKIYLCVEGEFGYKKPQHHKSVSQREVFFLALKGEKKELKVNGGCTWARWIYPGLIGSTPYYRIAHQFQHLDGRICRRASLEVSRSFGDSRVHWTPLPPLWLVDLLCSLGECSDP